MEEVTKISEELKEAYAEVDDLKTSGNLTRSCSDLIDPPSLPGWLLDEILNCIVKSFFLFYTYIISGIAEYIVSGIAEYITSGIISCTDKACSSGSLEFRDIYISILLFRAAYVWIKFRDVNVPRGAVYQKPGSNKFEPRIKFPVMKGEGGKSKRIPLGLYDTLAKAEVVYRIAAFYCNKPKHCLGRLDLGGGASFPIPILSLNPDLPYEEKVKQVGVQVMRVYAEFEEQKARRNLLLSVRGPTFEMPTGEGHVLSTSPIHQLQQPLDSRMDSSMQYQGSQLSPNIHNGVNFNNPNVSHMEKLLEAYERIECLKSRVSQKDFEIMQWEVKYSELERENGLLKHQIMQSHLQPLHHEQDFDTNRFLDV